MSALAFATVLLTAVGLFFYIAGVVGLLRFPNVYCRLHALTKADNLGLGMIALGLLLQVDSPFEGLRLLLIWILVMAASAFSCYLVANYVREGPGNDCD